MPSIIPNNQLPNEPELADVLNYHRKGIFLDLNCHHVGTVADFDPTRQVAKVTINYKRTYFYPNALGVVQPVLKDYPLIIDAPVIFLGGGGFSLTFPVEPGDECLVLFNDRDIDTWFAGSSSSPNPTGRLHSFSDAIVLVGLRSLPNVILNPDTDGVAVRNRLGTTKIVVRDDEVEFAVGAFTLKLGTSSYEVVVGESSLLLDANGVTLSSGVAGATIALDPTGKFSVTNPAGELVGSLDEMLTALQSATAGGYPLLLPPTFASALAVFQSFKA
jgi:hypothetical protein